MNTKNNDSQKPKYINIEYALLYGSILGLIIIVLTLIFLATFFK